VSIRIGFGLLNYPFESAAAFFRWVDLLERGHVDSLWQSDRLISTDPYLESLSALASLCGCTERIKFGMNAIVIPLRDPLVLAKQCATIDFLSNGRLLPMFGVGYPQAAEWAATGRDAEHRGSMANEMFELIARLWNEEAVDFDGRYFKYRKATIAPRPIQQPLPLWIGGTSEAAIKRTARLGSGWIGGIASADEVRTTIEAIKVEATRIGRCIDDDHFGTSLAYRIGSPEDDEVRNSPFVKRTGIGPGVNVNPLFCIGGTTELVQRLRDYVRAGASKFVLFPLARGEQDMARQTRLVIEEVMPHIEDRARTRGRAAVS
jgi:probable F420-dependent oxidoreductase